MDLDDHSVFETVTQVVVRYGMKRTTMADIARETGVSRQTLYHRYRDKDGIMAATIRYTCARLMAELRALREADTDLSEKIDAYYGKAVYPAYEMLQAMPDAADFESGMGPESVAAIAEMRAGKRAILTEIFAEFLSQQAPSPEHVAAYFEQVMITVKPSVIPPDALETFLTVCKTSVLAMAASNSGKR